MANLVQTRIRLHGKEKLVKKTLESVLSSESYIIEVNKRNNNEIMNVAFAVIPREAGHVDFNVLVPQPTTVYQANIGKDEERLYGKENLWWDWRDKNWGTVKNATDDIVEWIDGETCEITFCTSWKHPDKWLQELAKKAVENNVNIDGEYANEDFGCEMGYIAMNDPEEWEENGILSFQGSDYDKELYDNVWGEGMADTTGYFNGNDE